MDATEETIFNQALDQPDPQQRAAYLAACGCDPHLRQRVELLLSAYQHGQFLESPVENFAATVAHAAENIGTQIGPYRLLEQIGEGGMGVVYLAQQTQPVKRRVALKLIKPGMDSRQVLARFEAERQALALMDHPNIARVLDAGTAGEGLRRQESGASDGSDAVALTSGSRPYFVMELVLGLPITEYCDAKELPTRERLLLFCDVCRAVQHAHQKGVIHRDLKPSNVLVTINDGAAVVKVIDFGVAKALNQTLTERTYLTHFSQLVGTPLYMSPEQAELTTLDVDTRSDVYSLGVLLYELLTGHTPFDRESLKEVSFDELRRIIREDEPPPPSSRLSTLNAAAASTLSQRRGLDQRRLTQLLRGELDWIVMKALDKDRNGRYESASALAADLERYLGDEPVLAGPPSAAYRLRKFARRNRAALTSAGLVAAALVVGFGISTWQAVRAQRALRLADERYQALEQAQRDVSGQSRRATAAEDDAAARYLVAKEAVDTYLLRVNGDERLQQPAFRDLRKKLLESALPFLERLSARPAADASSEASRVEALVRLARVREDLGDFERALGHWQEALGICERLHAAAPQDVEIRTKLANVLVGIAAHHRLRSDDAAVFRPLDERALEICRQLAKEQPGSDAGQHDLAKRLNNVALGSTNPELKRKLLDEVVQIWEQLVRRQPGSVEFRESLASAYHNWGYHRPTSEALPRHQQALEIREQLAREQPHSAGAHIRCAESHHHLANMYGDDHLSAYEHRQQSVRVLAEFLKRQPHWPSARHSLASLQSMLALTCQAQKKDQQAAEASQASLDAQVALATEYPEIVEYQVGLGGTESNFGDFLAARGQTERGLELLNSARQRLTRVLETTGGHAKAGDFLRITLTHLARIHRARSNTLTAQGDAAGALAEMLTEHDLRLAAASDPDPVFAIDLGGTQCNLGNLHFTADRQEAAIEWQSRAIDTLEPLAKRSPKLLLARRFIVNAFRGRSSALVQLERYNLAYADICRAIEFDDESQLALRMQQLAIRTQISPSGAAAEIEELLSSGPTAEKYYRAAGLYTLTGSGVVSAADREQYQRRAVELLRRAHEAGYFQKPERIALLEQFESLSGREDFGNLRTAVQAAAKSP